MSVSADTGVRGFITRVARMHRSRADPGSIFFPLHRSSTGPSTPMFIAIPCFLPHISRESCREALLHFPVMPGCIPYYGSRGLAAEVCNNGRRPGELSPSPAAVRFFVQRHEWCRVVVLER